MADDADRPAGARRPLPAWAVLASALLVTLAAVGGIERLHRYAEVNFREVALFARIDAAAHHLEAEARQARGAAPAGTQGGWAEEPAATLRGAREEMERALAELVRIDADHGREARSAVGRYLADVDELARLVAAGEEAEAEGWDETHVDPSFAALEGWIAEEAREHTANAGRASRLVDVGTAGALSSAGLVIGLLFWRFERTGRAFAELAGEQRALAASEARFRALVEHSSDLVLVMDADGVIRYISPSITRLLGHSPAELLGSDGFTVVHPDDAPRVGRHFAEALAAPGATPPIELRVRHRDGSWRHVESVGANLLDDPAVGGVVINSRDVTERKAAEAALTHQAFHDPLTGLPNRALFLDRLGHALARSSDRPDAVAVVFLDLDNFKVVNDSLGHDAGDRLLVAAAERLRGCARPGDTVARLGGDEFVLLLEDAQGRLDAEAAAARVADCLRSPFRVAGHELFVAPSIGVALGGGDRRGAGDLLREAGVALYHAKRAGKARHALFEPRMDERAWARLRLEGELRRALAAGEFRLSYQPLVDLATGRVAEVEALVRWEHPERGTVPPDAFVPVAEESGLIVPLGSWVLEEACRQARAWHRERPDGPPLSVSVNLSVRQFQHPGVVADVARVLRETGLEPRLLTLEITESVAMDEEADTAAALRGLKALGVRLAVDDFGTGYSAFAYLRRCPVDALKIDRSCVAGLGRNPEDEAFVRAVVAFARMMGLEVTAEGIETDGQVTELRALGCERGQGFYFAAPLPAEVLTELLGAAPRWAAAAPAAPSSD